MHHIVILLLEIYHKSSFKPLGMNWVMDDLLEKFKELPTQKHEEGE